MEDLKGKQLGPYQIVAPLGEGGMAAVYKAYQPAMERYVALKVLPRHFAADPQFRARFQREAKLLAQLQHPHILPVFDFGQQDDYAYIVMPYIQSGTLADSLRGEALSLGRIRQVVEQVGDALNYAHGRGMIHRDVKPTNVLIDEGGNCLLTDFGLARMIEGSVNLTVSGTILGTPAYMSPEQGSGGKIDSRSDLYSLGVILYEMATGRVPYRAETPMAVIFKHIQDPLPPAHDLNPDLPEPLERVILKALSKRPEDRYQSAAEMVRATQMAIPGGVLVGERAGVRPEERRGSPARTTTGMHATLADRRSRVLPAWILAFAGLGLVVVVGGYFVVRLAISALTTRGNPASAPSFATATVQTPAPATPAPTTASATPRPTSAGLFVTLVPFSPSFPTLAAGQSPSDGTSIPAPGGAGSVLFDEDFDGGLEEDFSLMGGNWRVVDDEVGNAVYDVDNIQQSDYASAGFGDPTWSDYTVEYRVRFLETVEHAANLQFRRSADGSRLYGLTMDQNGINLYYTVNGGAWVPIASASTGLYIRRWYNMRVEAHGPSISVQLDNLPILDETDTKISQGALLLSVNPGTHAQFDSIRVTSLAE